MYSNLIATEAANSFATASNLVSWEKSHLNRRNGGVNYKLLIRKADHWPGRLTWSS